MNEIAGEIANDNGDKVVIRSRYGDYEVQFIPWSPDNPILYGNYVTADDMFDAIRKFLVGDD